MINETLLQAYRETDYWCAGLNDRNPVCLRIGQAQSALKVIYQIFQVDCAAFITACNPLSQALSDAENDLRQQRLLAEIRQAGYTGLIGEGRPWRPGWKPEASWLIPGMPLEAACAIGQRYQQNAIVWVGADCVPQLQVLV